jgi:hypothetical protein
MYQAYYFVKMSPEGDMWVDQDLWCGGELDHHCFASGNCFTQKREAERYMRRVMREVSDLLVDRGVLV